MLPVTDTVVPVCVVALTFAPPSTLPPVMLPLALKLVKIPTDVIFACAFEVTVPAVVAVVALVAVPALVAKVALATVPVTLAPVMLDSKLPLPTK